MLYFFKYTNKSDSEIICINKKKILNIVFFFYIYIIVNQNKKELNFNK